MAVTGGNEKDQVQIDMGVLLDKLFPTYDVQLA